MKKVYPIVIYKKENKEKYHIVYIPDIDTCTQAVDYAQAIDMAIDALGLFYMAKLEKKEMMIEPFTNKNKIKYTDCAIEIETLVSVDFVEYKKKLENKAVKKNVTIPYKLNLLGEREGINFSKVLTEALENILCNK